MEEKEIKRFAAEALSDFSIDRHYVVKAVYTDGCSLHTVKHYVGSFESLDPLIESLMDDDLVDLEVISTSLALDDFRSLGIEFVSPLDDLIVEEPR